VTCATPAGEVSGRGSGAIEGDTLRFGQRVRLPGTAAADVTHTIEGRRLGTCRVNRTAPLVNAQQLLQAHRLCCGNRYAAPVENGIRSIGAPLEAKMPDEVHQCCGYAFSRGCQFVPTKCSVSYSR
jgi:hypothetical protein